jgi:hypothetical protein
VSARRDEQASAIIADLGPSTARSQIGLQISGRKWLAWDGWRVIGNFRPERLNRQRTAAHQ